MTEQTRPHILVVDDNSEIREIIDVLLTGEGYRVIRAADGREALDKLKSTDFDLIILDIMMPGMDGYETCQSIRQISNVPVLFLSARASGSDKLFGFSSGGDDYLVKPFSYEELVGRAKALIRRYHIYRGKGTAVMQPAASSISYRKLTIDTSERGTRKILFILKQHGEGDIIVAKFCHLKIRTKLVLLIFAAGIFFVLLYNPVFYN